MNWKKWTKRKKEETQPRGMKAMAIEASSYCQRFGQSQLKKIWSTFQISIEGQEVTIDGIHQFLLVSECIFLVVLCTLTGVSDNLE